MQCYVIMNPFSRKEKCSLIVGSIGLILTIFALVMALYGFPTIIENELKKNIVLEEGNDAWERFLELPLPLEFKVHFIVIENPIELLRGDEKPRLKEIGPVVYKQFRKKKNITIDGDYVSYYQYQHYEFDPELTSKDISSDMEIETINALQLGMFQVLEKSIVKPIFKIEDVLDEVFMDTNFILKVKIDTLLFDGIKFCLPSMTTKFSSKLACLIIMLLNIKMIDYKEDRSMSYSIFGFKQDKHDGLYTINRGTSDLQKVGSIVKWEGLKYTHFWNQAKGMECDKVGGLDSTVYPPYIKENDNFLIYATDICRSAYLKYAGHSSYRDTDTYKFKMDLKTFYLEEEDREDSCFCSMETKDVNGEKSCFMDGVMDIQSCLGIPAVASMPHFLHADPKYLEFVDGLDPKPEIHESEMDIQPYTGFPTNGYKRAQINLILRPAQIVGQTVSIIENVKPSILPVLWIEEGLRINDEYYGILSSNLALIKGVQIGQWVFVGVAVALFVIPSGLFFVFRKKSK